MSAPGCSRATALSGYAFTSSARSLATLADLAALYGETAALNLVAGICGSMLYANGSFMQYIEGPVQAVEETRRRIHASRRHQGIIELIHEPIGCRSYDGWDFVVSHADTHPGLAAAAERWVRQSDTAAARASAGIAMLQNFWRTQVF